MTISYEEFLASKSSAAQPCGFDPGPLSEKLFPFQSALTRWALRRGRAGVFADTGLGKTIMELEWAKHVARYSFGRVLMQGDLFSEMAS